MAIDDSTLGMMALASGISVLVYHLINLVERSRRRQRYYANNGRDAAQQDLRDPAEQLRIVMAARFSKQKVMRFSEYAVFKIVEDEVSKLRGYRVFAQTSLGEVLKTDDSKAYGSINSKRVDILVIAPDGHAVLAVEYQGEGHYQNSAAARDAVKKEALRKAGIQYLEILHAHSPDEIRSMVGSALGRTRPSPIPPMPTTFGKRDEDLAANRAN